MNRINNNKGFTIIEVVLVLAIAGLIFLMVFIALPALQAGQRDTARKSDVSNVASAITAFTGSNRGKMPTTDQLEKQLSVESVDGVKSYGNLSNNIKSVVVSSTGAVGNVDVADGVITVYVGFKCGTAANTATQTNLAKGTARQFASVTLLEGGAGTGYCL
jgi:prepilin-type N-terminal cleavage/methylation domain-containing protein